MFWEATTLTSAGFAIAMHCQQKLPSGPLEVDDVEAIPFPSLDVLFHLEFKVGVGQVGSCGQEFEDTLLSVRDIKGSIATASL